MLAESAQVFCCRKGDEDRYRETLFDDSEVEDQPCTAKATSHCGCIIAGIMVSCYNNYIANKNDSDGCRFIPFKFIYELQLLNFEVE